MFKLLIIATYTGHIASSVVDYETREQAEIAYYKISSTDTSFMHVNAIRLYK